MENIRAQTHRFRNAVALSVGNGETVYLTPRDARRLTKSINRVAKSCENETYTDSACGTDNFVFEDGRA